MTSPGRPPPEPRSTTVRASGGMSETNRSAWATASASERSPIAPRARMTPSAEQSGASSAIVRRDDHTPVRVVAFGPSSNSLDLAQRIVHDLSVRGGHRLEDAGDARLLDLAGHLHRKAVERFLPALAIPADIDPQAGVVIAEAPLRGNSREILHGLQCGASGTDEQAEVVAGHANLEIVAVFDQFAGTAEGERRHELIDELLCFLADLSCVHFVVLPCHRLWRLWGRFRRWLRSRCFGRAPCYGGSSGRLARLAGRLRAWRLRARRLRRSVGTLALSGPPLTTVD